MKHRYIAFCLALLLLPAVTFAQSVEVLVNNRVGNAIQKYDQNGNYIGDFIAPGAGGLVNPEDILFHPDGSVLVSGFGNTAIKRYDGLSGASLGDFSSGYSLSSPSKMSIGPDSLIYITQWGSTQNKVVRFDLQGAFVDEFTAIGAPNGLGHLWDDEGNFYVALFGQSGSGTVHKFDTAGNDLGIFINTTVLQGPTDIWWDGNGDMLVEDWSTGKVLRYDTGGTYLGEYVTGMTNPEGIDSLPNGWLLIGDWGVDAVHLVDTGGNLQGYFCVGNGLGDPNGVKVRPATPVSLEPAVVDAPFVFPAMGRRFKVELPGGMEGAEILVRDLHGREMLRFQGRQAWTAQNWSAGLYFVEAQRGSQRIVQKVLVTDW